MILLSIKKVTPCYACYPCYLVATRIIPTKYIEKSSMWIGKKGRRCDEKGDKEDKTIDIINSNRWSSHSMGVGYLMMNNE